MSKCRRLSIDELLKMSLENTVTWCIPAVKNWALQNLPFPIVEPFDQLPANVTAVAVIGGGVLIDEAKVFLKRNRPQITLVVIPSIWGSGAEVSPVAVLNREGKKMIEKDPALLPDFLVVSPDIARSIPEERAAIACGDVWAHAMEGFLSPLATAKVREELSGLIRVMMEKRAGNDPEWFELSARACQGQLRSSVGLIHGIAHVLEGVLSEKYPQREIGHALLCSTLLWPVMSFNRCASENLETLLSRYELDVGALFEIFKSLFHKDIYDLILGELHNQWRTILRDQCTRTNSALVRPNSLGFFAQKEFL